MSTSATTLIGGRWNDPSASKDVRNPADGTMVGSIGYGGAREATAAADAAAAAFAGWSAATGRQRADVLTRAATELTARADDIGSLLSRESGKRVVEGVGEVRFAAEYFRWFAEQARRPDGEIVPSEVPGRRLLVTRRAAGVAVCLTPWNFPVSIPARKLAAALAAGATTVLRVSEKAPLAAVELIRCLDDAGIPAGVVNLVHGPAGELTDALLDHPAVRVVSFTGSTDVGRKIMTSAARRIVRPALELGGDAAFIVFDDADLDAAVDGAMLAKFRNNGQSCIGANRFLVQDGIYDEFVGRFTARVEAMVVGDPAGTDSDLGPLIDDSRVAAVRTLVDEALAGGGQLLTKPVAVPGVGSYAAPVLISDVPSGCGLAVSEVFGPAAAVFRFASDDEAITAANRTEMGLAGYAYTTSLARSERVQASMQVGILGLNTPLPSAAFVPMGGVKQSGIGREGGSEGMGEFQSVHYAAVQQ